MIKKDSNSFSQNQEAFTQTVLPVVRKRAVSPERSRRGFTLIELLIVIAIIGILSTIIIVSYNGVQERSRIAKAKGDVNSISSAIKMMYADTKMYPFGVTNSCGESTISPWNSYDLFEITNSNSTGRADPKIGGGGQSTTEYPSNLIVLADLSKGAGLIENNTSLFPNWSGPYIDQVPLADPWHVPYFFDVDYRCNGDRFTPDKGGDFACQGIGSYAGVYIRVVNSWGADKMVNHYGGDNVSALICKP